MRAVRAALLTAGALLVLLTPPPARAQTATSAIAAEELYREGRALLAQKHYAEACAKLEASERLDSSVGTLFSLGECYAAEGRNASAWFGFRNAAWLAAARGDHRRVGAEMRADALEPELAHLVIHLSDRPDDVRVVVDGAAIEAAALDTPLPVDPGTHRVEAHGAQSYEVSVDVPANGVTAQVVIPSLGVTRLPPVWKPAPSWKEGLGVAMTGVGSAAVVAGAVLGFQAIVRMRDVRSLCGSASTCPNEAAVHERDLAGTSADWSTALVAAGVAAGAAGLFVLATTHGTFAPVVGRGQAALDARWSW